MTRPVEPSPSDRLTRCDSPSPVPILVARRPDPRADGAGRVQRRSASRGHDGRHAGDRRAARARGQRVRVPVGAEPAAVRVEGGRRDRAVGLRAIRALERDRGAFHLGVRGRERHHRERRRHQADARQPRPAGRQGEGRRAAGRAPTHACGPERDREAVPDAWAGAVGGVGVPADRCRSCRHLYQQNILDYTTVEVEHILVEDEGGGRCRLRAGHGARGDGEGLPGPGPPGIHRPEREAERRQPRLGGRLGLRALVRAGPRRPWSRARSHNRSTRSTAGT